MSEKEKVMVVTLMRSDLYDAAGYAGAYLNLPASRDEIQDAMDRARISDGQRQRGASRHGDHHHRFQHRSRWRRNHLCLGGAAGADQLGLSAGQEHCPSQSR